jgi:P-type E1-E2 ATPase
VEQDDVFLGRPASLEEEGIFISSGIQEKLSSLETAGCSVILLAVGGWIEGLFVFEDELRQESSHLIQRLYDVGLNAVIVTGDNHAATQRVAEKIGIKQIFSERMPQEKVEIVKELQSRGH